jgi:hypothetical protein
LVIATMGCILSTGLISTLTGAGDSHISIIDCFYDWYYYSTYS